MSTDLTPLLAPRAFASSQDPSRFALVVTAGTYAVLVLVMWVPYTLYSGFGYETVFAYVSDTSSLLDGFLYRGDRLRIHTSTFYHLGYILGEIVGLGGSFVPDQVVYATLWWGRGFLVFLLMTRFIPRPIVIPYTAGALVLVHASDGALQWVGQMNQFGFIFWMLLACYLLVKALEAERRWAVAAFTVAACLASHMSLWSYESQIVLLLMIPIVFFALRPAWRRRLLVIAPAWYAVPAVYLVLTFLRYARSNGTTYQESVLRQDWSLGALASDWWFNIWSSLTFWNWVRPLWRAPREDIIPFALLATAVFIVGCWMVGRRRGSPVPSDPGPGLRAWALLLTVGLVLLACSFPVYLLLDSARSLWRTQLLSGVGAAVTLTAVLGIVSLVAPSRLKTVAFVGLAGVVTYFGSLSAIQLGALHRWHWERHRAVIMRILEAAPSVRPETLVVLTNVPKNEDPFGNNMWLDVALRLAYPGTPVAGIYFYTDGTPSPGNNIKMKDDLWIWDGSGFPPDVRKTSVANTVVISANGEERLEPKLPAFLCRAECPDALYKPSRVVGHVLSPRTARRYRIPW